ncbi:MAG: hypothetical protein AAFO07_27050 [Bacteroidota bacterium]
MAINWISAIYLFKKLYNLMESKSKLRVTQSYEKLKEEVKEQIKLAYPNGYSQHLIKFFNREGKQVSGLRFETDEKIYLIRMTMEEARDIVSQDEDYDEDGNLKDEIKDEYEDKYLLSDEDIKDLELEDPEEETDLLKDEGGEEEDE